MGRHDDLLLAHQQLVLRSQFQMLQNITVSWETCVLFQGPEWTQSMTEDLEKEYHIWLKERKDTTANRRKFASEHLGNTGRSCAIKIDMENFYPGTMHCAIRSSETIARKTTELIDILSLPKKKWLKCIAKVCKKDPQASEMIRFSEKGVLLFCKHSPNFLKETGLVGVYLTILENFLLALKKSLSGYSIHHAH